MWFKSNVTTPAAIAAISFCLIGGTVPAAADILHVPGDFPTIQAGIDAAVNGDEVVVADGVYTGDGNRDLDYNGKLITVRSENGPDNCIIDCQGNDADPHRGFYFHSGETAEARVEGVTIRGGAASIAGGGGMLCAGSSPTVTDCIFRVNTAEAHTSFDWGGGGMLCKWGGNPTVTDCIFIGNTVLSEVGLGHGGGMSSVVASPTVTNCIFIGNNADFGGGIYSEESSAMLTNCTFTQNSANEDGGGMYNFRGSLTVTNCTFSENAARGQPAFGGGGGGMYNFETDPTVANCTFSQNTTYTGTGGGMHNNSSSPSVTNCTFSGNEAVAGGGVWNRLGYPVLTDCTFSGNVAENAGGGVYQATTSVERSPTYTKCIFVGNVAGSVGGGMYTGGSWFPPVLVNCVFALNRSGEGGGMYAYHSVASVGPSLTNCSFIQNLADTNGGGLYIRCSSPVVNCSFAGNVSLSTGGGMYISSFGSPIDPSLFNSVLWGNSPNQIFDSTAFGSLTVASSDVQGGYDGAGNIDANPLFVDPENGDLHFSPGSPCIDAGDNTAVPKGIDTDLDGNPRFVDDSCTDDTGYGDPPIVDMGAYEFQVTCPWDLDCNGTVGASDLLSLLVQWGTDPGGPPDFDGDDIVGASDLLALLVNWGPCP